MAGTLPFHFRNQMFENYFGIVCDGCSSSKHVDVGARYLAMAAMEVLKGTNSDDIEEYIRKDFSNEISEKIIENLKASCIPDFIFDNNALDSTLIVMISNGYEGRAYFYGDGYIVEKTNVALFITKVEYESNAPNYLSYNFYEGRSEAYKNTFGKSKYVVTKYTYNLADMSLMDMKEEEYTSDFRFSMSFDHQKGSSVSIFSDGYGTFFGDKNINLSAEETLKAQMLYSNYPQANGEFVLRNFKWNTKVLGKKGITHSDDLSCATIYCKEIQGGN